MRRLAWCTVLVLVVALVPSIASAREDRDEFCKVISDFARDHAEEKGSKLTRAIGDLFAALAPYAKPSVADDLRLVARFYRLRAKLGSSREAAQVLELSPAELGAAKGRIGRYQIAQCLGDGARMRG